MRSPFLSQAIEEAKKAAALGEVPVGAVLVSADGQVLAATHNLVETHKDPTAHAELLAIRTACEKLGSTRLPECDLYVTLEPCPMCATAISFARIRRLYFGANDEKGGGVENGARVFSQSSCHHKPEIYSAMAQAECAGLLNEFFKARR